MMEPNGVLYGAWTAGAVLLGLLVFLGQCGRGNRRAAGWTAGLAIPLGLIGARAFYVLARIGFFLEIGGWNWLWPEEMFADWGVAGGFALWGAVGGVALAAVLSARKTGMALPALMDALAPGAALAIGLYRLGEYWIGEGVGPYVETESLCFFPLAVMNEWEEWRMAVFIYEGLAALIIFAVLMTWGRRKHHGDRARVFLILYCSAQILLESLRRDSFLRWMFVRVSQLTAALVLLGLMAAAVWTWKQHPDRSRLTGKTAGVCGALYLLGIGACVALEFAMDKSATLELWLAYVLEGVCCVILGIAAWRVTLSRKREDDQP